MSGVYTPKPLLRHFVPSAAGQKGILCSDENMPRQDKVQALSLAQPLPNAIYVMPDPSLHIHEKSTPQLHKWMWRVEGGGWKVPVSVYVKIDL